MNNPTPKIAISLTDLKPTQINEAALHHGSSSDHTVLILSAIGGAILIGAMIALGIYLRRKYLATATTQPELLFKELCDAHALPRAQRTALRKLAKQRKLTNPSLILVDADLWPINNDLPLSKSTYDRLKEAHRRLFQPMEAPSAK